MPHLTTNTTHHHHRRPLQHHHHHYHHLTLILFLLIHVLLLTIDGVELFACVLPCTDDKFLNCYVPREDTPQLRGPQEEG